jgi:HEXXH motif-containing protein
VSGAAETIADSRVAADWSRLARPQADGYDTDFILGLATTGGSVLRPDPWRRRPSAGAPTLFDGRVAIRNRESGGLSAPRYAPASPDHPNLAAGEAVLRHWPEAAAQFPALVDTVQPWTDTTIPDSARQYPGSSSHSEEAEFGIVMVTVDNAFGLAQAMVHEMAHHKLRALGVSLLEADRIVTNDPDVLYTSPIVVDRKRPMTAVLHAQYSFMHVTALDVAVYHGAGEGSELRGQAVYLLARNVPRMEVGHEVLGRHLVTDDLGASFHAGFRTWSEEVLSAGRAILDAEGYGMPTL